MARDDVTGRSGRRTRRAVLRAAAGTAGLTALAGCSGILGGGSGSGGGSNATGGGSNGTGDGEGQSGGAGNATAGGSGQNTGEPLSIEEYQGSGPLARRRPPLEGTSIEDLPPLNGELTIYLGGGEGGLYIDLIDLLRRRYPNFAPKTRLAPSTQLASTILEETRGGQSPADVFFAVDAGSLGVVANNGATVRLPQRVTSGIPDTFHPDDQWIGVAGRARSIPFNTNRFSKREIPKDVFAFANRPNLASEMGWAPTYEAFQSFVTAMRIQAGERRTRGWLQGMMDAGITEYPDEFLVSNAVADGEIGAGFANHYYALRVQAARPDAPIDLAFTSNDAGALVNVAGAEIVRGTQQRELAANFVHHLLTVEAQEFFATRAFGYPVLPGVPPVGGLPTIDQLNPPNVPLAKLANIQPTLRLMREVGVL